MSDTLHWQDEQAEIHKVVVGPMDNNVYVLRCKQTGDAVLLDAGYEVHVTQQDAAMLPSYDQILEDDAVLSVGRLRLRTIHTPGHTPGSMCFLVEGSPVLFSGDTLFPGGPGNTTFEGGDFATIIRSIDDRLFSKIPADTIVLPGHGDDTTIGNERPSLQEWVDRGW
jgi:glyoxylase-like metal-dependent hydrolase (beta-lactamase superfamily II)